MLYMQGSHETKQRGLVASVDAPDALPSMCLSEFREQPRVCVCGQLGLQVAKFPQANRVLDDLRELA